MLFIVLVNFKGILTDEVVARNLADIETDTIGGIRIVDAYWTPGRYDNVIIFEAPDEKVAMEMALRRTDRMEIETLVALPAGESSPAGPA